jgi:hypothetical protein
MSGEADAEAQEGAPVDLGELLDAAMRQPWAEIAATRHDGGIGSASKPQKFKCSDNRLYAVKFKQNTHGDGKGIFNEQVATALGQLLGAPVAPVELVRISQGLADELNASEDPNKVDFEGQAGLHHGSRWKDNQSGRQQIAHVDENREAFGALDVLFAWGSCQGDQQWIYDNDPPHAVLSTDHSPFFGGLGWDANSLRGTQEAVVQDPVLGQAGLTPEDRKLALDKLAAVGTADIIHAVASPPAEWGVTREERLALAEYLLARKDRVIELLA